jgi:hypothetical protein
MIAQQRSLATQLSDIENLLLCDCSRSSYRSISCFGTSVFCSRLQKRSSPLAARQSCRGAAAAHCLCLSFLGLGFLRFGIFQPISRDPDPDHLPCFQIFGEFRSSISPSRSHGTSACSTRANSKGPTFCRRLQLAACS